MPDAQFFRDVRPQYAKVEHSLAVVLKSLSADEWNRPATPLWTVKDVAAHLLDGHIRALSLWRDGYYGEQAGDISTHEKLVGFINRLNSEWTQAARRISPAVLIHLRDYVGRSAGIFCHARPAFPCAFPCWMGRGRPVHDVVSSGA